MADGQRHLCWPNAGLVDADWWIGCFANHERYDVTGSFAFTTPTTAPGAGTQPESVTFTPTDLTDYSTVTSTINVQVNKATPTVTWPTASAITYGQTLASSMLTGGSAMVGSTSVAGSFAFTTPTTAPVAGTQTESVTFTPTDQPTTQACDRHGDRAGEQGKAHGDIADSQRHHFWADTGFRLR